MTEQIDLVKLKEDWCLALESGKYIQGHGQLKGEILDEDNQPTGKYSYCCLGVLKEVAELKNNDSIDYLSTISDRVVSYTEAQFRASVILIDFDSQEKLAQMNDNHIDFSEIAKYIRENVNFISNA